MSVWQAVWQLSLIHILRRVDELTDGRGKYPADITAEALIQQKVKNYDLDKLKKESGEKIELSPLETLELVNIRYTMGLTAYKRYEKTTVVDHVQEETRAELLENQAELLGVECAQTTERVYNDALPFSLSLIHISRGSILCGGAIRHLRGGYQHRRFLCD